MAKKVGSVALFLAAQSLLLSVRTIAAESTGEVPSSVTSRFTNGLPDTWTCEIRGSRLVLAPRKEFEFVNLTNAEGQSKNETADEYKRRHKVRFHYQIVVRFEPKLSPVEYSSLITENRAICYSIKLLEDRTDAAKPTAGRISKEMNRLMCSFRSVPVGYVGNLSVYVEPTYLGYASFLHDDERLESEAVEKQVVEVITRYFDEPSETPRRTNARPTSKRK
ncbi:MAG: hypothetical protein WCL32_25830 [Planctomycetota bacterium]